MFQETQELKFLKAKFLERFINFFPLVPHRLRSCLHSYDDISLNPYHLEDDTWAHTMMVYMAIDISDLPEEEQGACLIAALCHDIGKIYKRTSHKPGKINMWGHPEASTQFTAEVCNTMFGAYKYSDRVLHLATFAVSHHITAYDVKESELSSFFNNDRGMFEVLSRLMHADYIGQISLISEHSKKDVETFTRMSRAIGDAEFGPREAPSDHADIVFHCGIPGTGKDYYATRWKRHIISFDKCRLQLADEAEDEKPDPEIEPKEYYKYAFLSTKKLNFTPMIREQLLEAKENNELVSICNTFTTTKSRKKMVNVCRNVYGYDAIIACHYIFTALDQAIVNDLKRENKTVGKDVIYEMAMRQKIPNLREGFDEVHVTFNYYGL